MCSLLPSDRLHWRRIANEDAILTQLIERGNWTVSRFPKSFQPIEYRINDSRRHTFQEHRCHQHLASDETIDHRRIDQMQSLIEWMIFCDSLVDVVDVVHNIQCIKTNIHRKYRHKNHFHLVSLYSSGCCIHDNVRLSNWQESIFFIIYYSILY